MSDMIQLFVPQLQIRRAGEEDLAVQAVAHAPNGCYSAGEVEVTTTKDLYLSPEGSPGDGIGIPDPVLREIEEPLLKLHVHHSEKSVCPQVIKPLRFRAEVDPVDKADEVHAVTLVDGREMGRGSEPIPSKGRIPDEPSPLSTEDWTAYVDRQPDPSGEPRLIVTGTVMLRHQGFEVDLVEATGKVRSRLQQVTSDPSVLLDLQIKELGGHHPQTIYRPTVRYETNSGDPAGVEQVAVLEPSGAVTKIPVKEMQ